uniref:Insulin n=1 Tax=Conus planorbis TaxID=97183 RepID=A0A1B3IIZ7_CONPO|nr:insulin precursor [Conus planorbis]
MTSPSYFLWVALGLLLYVYQASPQEYVCDSSSSPHQNGVCGAELTRVYEEMCETEASKNTRSAQRKRRQVFPLKKQLSLLKAKIKRDEDKSSEGMSCECCKHHCDYEEITEYCPELQE